MDYKLAKQILFHSLWAVVICACTKSNKEQLSELDTIPSSQPEKQILQLTPTQPYKTPLDTIVASSTDKNKLLVLVYEYYDSLPNRPIKNFEVVDAHTNQLVFRPVYNRLNLGDEINPIEGTYDSLKLVPVYAISSKNPLKVNLGFQINGSFMIGYLEDITYPFYENTPERFSFLQYSFLNNNNGDIQSSLLFPPRKCETIESELLSTFNKLSEEGILDTQNGDDFLKIAFNCYLNGDNNNFEKILTDYKNTKYGGYFSYLCIVYLDQFIINIIL